MQFLKRKYQESLKVWKSSNNRKPLLLRGARQVGKSRLIREFGKTEFAHFFTFNFEEDPSLKEIFRPDLNVQRIVSSLEIRCGTAFSKNNTLLFFDEIQACPEAITALRYFYENAPEYFIVAAGSLLEFALEKISFPVGRVDTLYIFPFDFEEFLRATNRPLLADRLPVVDDYEKQLIIDDALVEQLFKALYEYLIIGGMPAVIVTYLETQSFIEVFRIQSQLVNSIIDDTRKYARGNLQLENIATVLQQIPKMMGQEITYTTLGEHDSHQRTKKSLEMLNRAMICTLVKSCSPASIPLMATGSEKHFKCIFLDVGLASRLLGIAVPPSELSSIDGTIFGKILEQFVGQQLLSNQDEQLPKQIELYCWIRAQRTAKAEVDYLIMRKGKIIPVEVKSESFGKLRSLKVLLNEFPNIENALVLSLKSSSEIAGKMLRVPVFCKI